MGVEQGDLGILSAIGVRVIHYIDWLGFYLKINILGLRIRWHEILYSKVHQNRIFGYLKYAMHVTFWYSFSIDKYTELPINSDWPINKVKSTFQIIFAIKFI